MDNKRRHYFIDKSFQTKFIIKFAYIVVLSSAFIAVLLLFFLRNSTTVAIENTHVYVKSTSDFILPVVIQIILWVSVFASLAVIILTLLISHKISGPLYRLKKEIDRLKKGELNLNFNTRSNDQLKNLSQALVDMNTILKDKILFLQKEFTALSSLLKSGPLSPEIERQIKAIEEILSFFRT